MEAISINVLDLRNTSSGTILSLAKAYQKVFSTDSSWNEFYKCPKCDSSFPESYKETECSYCKKEGYSVPLVEYWPISVILGDFYKEMAKKDAICVIAVNEKKEIIGFCWGYFVKVGENLEKHLEAPGLVKSIRNEGVNDEYVAYQDEIAVVPEYQGKGIAKKLFIERHRHFCNVAPKGTVLFRTLFKPVKSITYKWMVGKLGYKVINKISNENRVRIIASKSIAQI